MLDIDNADVREDVELATRYIYRLLSQKKTKLNFKTGQKIKVAYHTPCHMEKLGWAYYSIELLKLIPNIELTILDLSLIHILKLFKQFFQQDSQLS